MDSGAPYCISKRAKSEFPKMPQWFFSRDSIDWVLWTGSDSSNVGYSIKAQHATACGVFEVMRRARYSRSDVARECQRDSQRAVKHEFLKQNRPDAFRSSCFPSIIPALIIPYFLTPDVLTSCRSNQGAFATTVCSFFSPFGQWHAYWRG